MKHTFTLIYHSENIIHQLTRARVSYLIKAARSRGGSHRPRKQASGDILLGNIATIFRHAA